MRAPSPETVSLFYSEFCHVPYLRTDRKKPSDRPQRQPCQQQDQARVPAQPAETLDRSFKFRVSTNGLRSVEHVGGLDNWLLKTADEKLSTSAVKVKRELKKQAAV
jgi:ribosomal protein L28